ncbi:MAG: hypothetical protein C5B48_13355, partial [Candidatus Rokuibacteriota bacterium]
MRSGTRLLAAWLTPVLWLHVPGLIAERGPGGVWIGLTLALSPLIALAVRSEETPSNAREPVFPVVVLVFSATVLLWANIMLAGDLATEFGAPRWMGIAVTAIGGWLVTGWR